MEIFGKIDIYFVIAVVIAYLLGSISPSTILARAEGRDIKKEGSGNAGTTNTLRVLGAKAALITLIVDVGKGILAVSIAYMISTPQAAMAAALAAFIGHVWPVFFGFKGGKGVAVAFGTILRIDWRIALILLLVVIVMVLLTRKVSLASISAALAFPVLMWFMNRDFLVTGSIMALILIIKHWPNIVRLVKGEEDSIDLSKFLKHKKAENE